MLAYNGLNELSDDMGEDGSESPRERTNSQVSSPNETLFFPWRKDLRSLKGQSRSDECIRTDLRLKINSPPDGAKNVERRRGSIPPQHGTTSKTEEPWDEKRCLLHIASANDIRHLLLEDCLDEVKKLELVMEKFIPVSTFGRFPNLQELVLVSQGLTTLTDIGSCRFLKKLVVSENKLTSLEGLSAVADLEFLDASFNRISSLGLHLRGLSKLHTLRIASNRLETLSGLSHASGVVELHAPGNRIEELGRGLRDNLKLQRVNLASNRIRDLSEVFYLTLLPELMELHMADLDFSASANPVCKLKNFETFCIYHLPHLKIFNKTRLDAKIAQVVCQTYSRKQLYYTTRLRVVKRRFVTAATEVSNLHKANWKAKKRLLREIEDQVSKQSPVSASPASSRPTVQEAKIVEEALRESLIVKQMVLARMEELKQRAERSLLWEHESAGNVFFERGTPSHDWYNDVVHLVTSRFHLKEFQPLSVKGVQVKAVTKIHNRLLEHRFNEHHARLVEDGGSRSEVLFYGVDPAAPQEMHWVCRRGFLSAEKANERGIHPFVPLCTSLYGADAPRLRSFFKTESSSAGAREVLRANEEWHLFTEDGCVTAEGMDWVFEKATMLFPPGELLICRAIIHQPTLSCLMVGDDHVCGPSALWQKKPMAHLVPYSDATEETEVEDEDKDGIREAPTLARSSTASYRYREGQPHDKYWWILSPDVVLPLYHVVIGYETEERSFASPWSGRQLNRKIPSDDERRRLPECRKHAGLFAEDLAHRSSSAPVGSLFSSSTDTSQPLVALEARAGEAPSDACAEDEHDTLGEFLEILNFYRSFVSTSGDLTRGCGHSASYRLGKQLDGGTSACDGSESGMDDYRSSSTEERTMPLRTAAGSQKRSQVYLPPRSCQTQASDGFGDRSAYRTHGLLLGGRGVLNEATLWGHDGDQLRRALKINSETDYRSMTSIELPNAGLIAIEPSLLERAHQLRELRLPWNKIKSFEDILPCVGDTPHLFPRLTLLDVSFNEIKDVPAFIWAPDLRTLDVSFNEISDVQSIKVIATRAPNIEELRIKGNPVACVDSASESFCGALPRLLSFDGDALRKTASSDRNSDALTNKSLSSESALSTYDLLPFCYLCPPAMGVNSRQPEEHGMLCSRAVLSVKKAFELKASCGSEKGEHTSPLHASGAACAWTETGNSAAEMGAMHLSPEFGLLTRNFLHGLSRVNWPAYINCIELPSQKLSTVPDLRIFSNLRRAVLSHNKLSSLQPLLACAKLETVIASDNFLVDLGELYQLQELRHLDVAQNMIKEFPSSLDAPRKLCFLALENNLIEHVSNLELFDNLTQLFLSYNRLSDFRSIIHLGSRGGLKVLDLAGNPLCRLPDYRDYTLYLLNGLKILDGIAVNSKHQVQIREAFSGKVTAELLEQLLGSAPPYAAESVDLGDRNLRHLGDVITSFNFPNVKEMNLDGNLLTSLAGVEHLPKLEVLCINRNRVEIRGRSLGGVSLNDTRHFPNLQRLELSYNCISECRDLQSFKWERLSVLHLAGNSISSVEGLGDLHALRELDLSHNKIRRCLPGSFQNLVRLERLNLEQNGLKTLSNISPLPSLKFLNVARNRIKDVVEVEKLIDLSSLRYLLFYGNPASSVASYRVHVLHYLRHLAELDAKSPTNDELAEAELIRLRRQIKQQQSLPTVNAPALSSDSKAKKKKVAVQVLNLGVDQNHHPLSLSLSSVSKTPAGSSKSTVPSTSLRRRRPFS